MRAFRAGFLFCGLGAGARGFLEARARLGEDVACFVSVGGVDIDPESCADFQKLTGSRATRADVATMTPAELRDAWGATAPDCVFLSPPCKGFSALLSATSAAQPKYQALNRLVLQGIFLLCETWPDAPPATIVLENVPRITSRGAKLLEQVCDLLRRYGYVLDRNTHDCGEIGGLGQHRRRFLLVARRPASVPAFIYRPPIHRVKGCGEILDQLVVPVGPDALTAGPLHALPRISWLTWVRLALIPPGGDWRDLPGVVPPGGERRSVWARYDVRGWHDPARTVAGEGSNGGFAVADPRAEGWFRGTFGVKSWDEPSGTVTGRSAPSTGAFAVADPRLLLKDGRDTSRGGAYGVLDWQEPAHTITGDLRVAGSNTPASVADPRIAGTHHANRHHNQMRVTDWQEPAGTVIGATRPGSGAASVADPRLKQLALAMTLEKAATFKGSPGLYGVNAWGEAAGAVTGSASVSGSNARAAVADPRVPLGCAPRAGVLGVLSWEQAAATITGNARVDNGAFAVADPRQVAIDPPPIVSAWDCWHRPMTTLELASLQGLPSTHEGEPLTLAGTSSARWRERIGNAVPVGAAKAIGESILTALLAGALGTWTLGSTGIWVRNDGRSELEWQPEVRT